MILYCDSSLFSIARRQDPKQRRIFSADELGDLFTLGDDGSLDGFNDTVDLFQVNLEKRCTALSKIAASALSLLMVTNTRYCHYVLVAVREMAFRPGDSTETFCHTLRLSQGEGKINAPDTSQQGPTRKGAEGAGDNGRRRKGARRKSGKSQRDQSLPRGEDQAPNSSSLIRTATVTIDPEQGQDAGKGGDNEKSNTDDMAVLQALYDGAPLSSVFHHDLAEGTSRCLIECDYCIGKSSYWFVLQRICKAPVLPCTFSRLLDFMMCPYWRRTLRWRHC